MKNLMIFFKKNVMKILILSILFVSFSGCVSLNSVSVTPVPVNKTQPVKVQKERFIFLGFNFDNDFVDSAVEDLKLQCPNGKISGVLTKDENINYFLYFFWKKQLTVSGYCLPHENKQVSQSTSSNSVNRLRSKK